AKFYAEMRHRALQHLPIIDIRVFNYISRHQDLSSRFLITDMIRAARDSTLFTTTLSNLKRDYLSPADFYGIIAAVLSGPNINAAIDCFTKAPVDKHSLLSSMRLHFDLNYEFTNEHVYTNVTGLKQNYFSENYLAAKLFNYTPKKTALEAVIEEVAALLSREITVRIK